MSVTVTYNNITLQMVNVVLAEYQPVYNGPTYLWTRYHFCFRGVYSPQATSYSGPPGGTPTVSPNRLAPTTDMAIRDALMQPQSELLIANGDQAVLDSPGVGLTTDANLGPFPRGCTVQEYLGSRTWIVDWEVETFVNEDPDKSIVVSHRWQMAESIDLPSYLSTVKVEGVLSLRSDLMLAANLVPDDFRMAIFHPLRNGYRRQKIRVVQGEGGNEYFYSYEDRQLVKSVASFTGSIRTIGITKCEAFQTSSVAKHPADVVSSALTASVGRTLGAEARINAELAGGGVWAWIRRAAITAGVALAGDYDFAITAINYVPRVHYSIIARVWGNADSSRATLRTFALGLCLRQLGTLDRRFNATLGGLGYRFTEDLAADDGQFVEVEVTYQSGFERLLNEGEVAPTPLQLANPATTLGAQANALRRAFTVSSDIVPPTEDPPGHLVQRALGAQVMVPPKSGGTRGTLPQSIIAQALRQPHTLDDAPDNNRVPNDQADIR